MRKNIKLPTILGLIILVFGVTAGIYLINSNQEFKLSANVEAIPKNVRFSNITNKDITVTWTTDIESNGFAKWGQSESTLSKIALEEGTTKSFVHSANIISASENSNLYIKINSDTKDYDNNGVSWQTRTLASKINQGNSLIASGKVLLPDSTTAAKAIVYISINGTLLSGITSDEGSFIIPVSTYVENVSDTTPIEITVNAGNVGTSQAVLYKKAIKSIPTIIIGKTYDFRSLQQQDDATNPESKLSVPESVEISSRFEVQKSGDNAPTTNETISIESVNEGEIINTTNPEFFGKAPKNSDIQVEIHSELQEATVTTDAKGVWKWSPPNNLEPGEHKVVLKWRDATGILRTVTRSFVVQASEGPAFESTPSAVPTDTATSTSTPTTKPSSTPKVSSPSTTAPPTPETGSMTPTLGLFMMGIGILMSSMFIWRKSDVN